ncbi:ABC transporter ATP-binding protein [Mycoplasmopsis pullorum]|uniref:ATP-binding cassette domain-containing protein n=1 Tax=Mycoplasmopsis pullorum TaxID=48003 RepID=UPI00111A7D94|nr:ABC transporter ATP-binding protein [Mycoplasmopsis pullorum]TNK82462.1 ABC transporter ATP-binding protein [Mycoplasmopsis pullorum]TNK83006.1 ABC transporter ATP-binding protein [Mycoplasmopsis pullorum]TNK85513.1 ABC transporter ATP-binding protein [Mycoplasmopsis pullorum]TNK86471.1 ABC transporter ATP-binding protein [Mycoplasmopsis pullorum]TNK87758.1 ABC transporter ATP-binding protein [Mycoplasmopsis pullorum]
MKTVQNNLITLKNVVIKDKNQTLVRDASFTIPKNQIVGIIGKSGSGKTTTINAIVQPKNVFKGEIEYAFSNPHNHKKWLKTISYITQEPNLIDDEDVYFNMKRLYRNHGNWLKRFFNFLDKNDKENLKKSLELVGLSDKIYFPVYKLSGGEKQRLEIAKALFNNSEIIFADEPTSNLDLKNSDSIMRVFKQLKEMNKTIIIVIHDINLALEYCDKLILFKDGKVKKTVKKEQFQRSEIENFFDQ